MVFHNLTPYPSDLLPNYQCTFSMYHLSLVLIVLERHMDSLIPLYIPSTTTLPIVFRVANVLLEAFYTMASLVG